MGSVIAAPRLQNTGLVALRHKGSSLMGIKPMSPALAGRFFTTELPGKPLSVLVWFYWSRLTACRVLAPWSEMEPGPVAGKREVLTTALPGHSPRVALGTALSPPPIHTLKS